ncbi:MULTISPECIES: hypothetical protein [Chitinophagaceae]
MKKIIMAACLLVFACIGKSSFAQLKVGRSKEQIEADKDKATPHFIGSNNLITPTYELY